MLLALARGAVVSTIGRIRDGLFRRGDPDTPLHPRIARHRLAVLRERNSSFGKRPQLVVIVVRVEQAFDRLVKLG